MTTTLMSTHLPSTEIPEGRPGSLATAGLSPFHLTNEQVRSFDENGYLVLRQWITGDLLRRMQDAGKEWIEQGLEIQRRGETTMKENPDYAFANRPTGKVFYRVNYLHGKGCRASLELLGSPQVLAVAESLCGRNFVPTYESMVFKMPGDGQIVPWHQDAVFPRKTYRIFNFDLYLDRSTKDGGALRVLPGTHREVHNVCKVAEDYGWDHPDLLILGMEPGDVLLHDDMVLHGSPQVEGHSLRRTVYYEFRPIEQILDEGPWDQEWADKRLRLLPVALDSSRQRYSEGPEFSWKCAAAFRPSSRGTEEEELRIVHTVHTAGSYCSAGGTPAEKRS
jgi:ectoine hydroxylase-related dioxygenase (phytanoyl-CoA dioxygenase family)